MNRPIKREWLNPFRQQPELEAQAYEVGFEPKYTARHTICFDLGFWVFMS